MTLPANAVQKAVYERLTAALGGTPVYDHVPQDAAFPYVVIGDDTAVPRRTKSYDGQEFTLTVHCWTALTAGRKAAKALMEAAYGALHLQPDSISVSGSKVLDCACEFGTTYQENIDGQADHCHHGVLRFRLTVYQD